MSTAQDHPHLAAELHLQAAYLEFRPTYLSVHTRYEMSAVQGHLLLLGEIKDVLRVLLG